VTEAGLERILNPGGGAEVAHAREHLAPFKVPKRVILVDTLPRNTAGKLLKRELRTQFASGV
jgi:fatty-acyl-CoA synthase